ncbi:MAG: DNA-processing protein DprA [Candidatus Omnitrophica bacterium]|nr:DNA-processing protein DprA [Candidatus Omnitrophota bacterium]MDD5574374.1 DNA-processing protein DprA [Candidatus Omnitrophota bacterium]
MNDFQALVLLNMVKGIGSIRTRRLLDAFSRPADIFQAAPQRLVEAAGLSHALAQAVVAAPVQMNAAAEIARAERLGIRILTITEEGYPRSLRAIPDPPAVLYVKGDLLPCDENACAIVGSRGASFYGLSNARVFGSRLCEYGLTIVSGLARGIDTAAHRAVLDARGRTIAVLGSGLERIYPPENETMFHQIAATGAVISQFPLQAPPLPQNFPMRNRIISGLSKGVLVVEASAKSGALITARCALEQGREVFALPGEITQANAAGVNALIKDGACLVSRPEEILETLKPLLMFFESPVPEQPPAPSQQESLEDDREEVREVWQSLDGEPSHIDNIAQKTGLTIPEILSILVELELKGIVRRFPGQSFTRNAS